MVLAEPSKVVTIGCALHLYSRGSPSEINFVRQRQSASGIHQKIHQRMQQRTHQGIKKYSLLLFPSRHLSPVYITRLAPFDSSTTEVQHTTSISATSAHHQRISFSYNSIVLSISTPCPRAIKPFLQSTTVIMYLLS